MKINLAPRKRKGGWKTGPFTAAPTGKVLGCPFLEVVFTIDHRTKGASMKNDFCPRALFCAFVTIVCGLHPSHAQSRDYYRSYQGDCISAAFTVYSAETGQPRQERVYSCQNNKSFYIGNGGGPDYSRELYVFMHTYTTGIQDNDLVFIEIIPGREYAYRETSPLGVALKKKFVGIEQPDIRSWASAKMTPSFLPTFWTRVGTQDFRITSLRRLSDWPYTQSPLRYDSQIIIFGGMTFRRVSDFPYRLTRRTAQSLEIDTLNLRHELVIYMNPEDGDGRARMALVPYVPVKNVQRQFNALTADPDVATFALGNIGLLAQAMAPFAAAYRFYNDSGMAEDDRQRCAAWKRNGQRGIRPTAC
jgi:hypothetical protein